MNRNTLEVDNLNVGYNRGSPVVENFNYSFESGLIYGLLGPSGCGKTTLIRTLAGLETPTKGIIRYDQTEWANFNQQPPAEFPCEKRNIGFVFQNHSLWPHLTVFENVAFPLECRKYSKADITHRVSEILNKTEILDLAKRYPSQLSGGQAQRVALARALVINPKILFLDEPFSALDASLRAGLRGELKSLHKSWNGTIILVSHDWADIEHLCHKVLIMEKGKLIQEGAPAQVKSQPKNLFVETLVKV